MHKTELLSAAVKESGVEASKFPSKEKVNK